MESPFDIVSNKTFALYIETILDPNSKEYIEVISLDVEPDGPLKACVFLAKNAEQEYSLQFFLHQTQNIPTER